MCSVLTGREKQSKISLTKPSNVCECWISCERVLREHQKLVSKLCTDESKPEIMKQKPEQLKLASKVCIDKRKTEITKKHQSN